MTARLPRPRVTDYYQIVIVPVAEAGEVGPATGSHGRYDVVFVVGVPGTSGATSGLDFDGLLSGGDSLLDGAGLKVTLEGADRSRDEAKIVPNAHRRLARVHLAVTADSFEAAERKAHDEVVPTLSWIAYEADTPLEVAAVLITEQATQIRRVSASVMGSVQPAPTLAGVSTPELRPFLAAYREGLNSNSPLYQALCFYKVIEGVSAFHKKRTRAASRGGGATAPDPLTERLPADPSDLPVSTPWERDPFTPYLGMTFAEIQRSVHDAMRNAVSHLTPGRYLRVADYFDDLRACRAVVPVLRYMARALIRDEIAQLGSAPSPSPNLESRRHRS